MKSFVSVAEIADRWNISQRRVQTLCSEGRIKAERIGNSWVIDPLVEKPLDARLKRKSTDLSDKQIRNIIKNTVESVYCEFFIYFEKSKAKICTLAFLSSILLKRITKSNTDYNISGSEELCAILSLFNGIINLDFSDVDFTIKSDIQNFLDLVIESDFRMDNSLSWAYQYLGKLTDDTGYESTQFFTEEYMVKYLTEETLSEFKGVILDPACGGGNFLIYASKVLRYRFSYTEQELIHSIRGYDIDPLLATIASINLRLCFMRLFNKTDVSDFLKYEAEIFCPYEPTIGGSISYDNEKIFKIGTGDIICLNQLKNGVTAYLTNPPFKTVKGMDLKLKGFLKHNYPECSCDMCNSFLMNILSNMTNEAKCGIVLQNGWMFLKTHILFRKRILDEYSIESIIQLGSGSFHDLSGEKASVSLVIFSKKEPTYTKIIDLKSYTYLKKVSIIEEIVNNARSLDIVPQQSLLKKDGSIHIDDFELLDSLFEFSKYGDYAIPMQGTSTGNSNQMVDYFWNHIGDENWVLVSKGGGYSRWQGLNCFSVKWGKDGSFIKNTPGSALRNVNYFDKTQMVFSDTGTSGLNVRILLPGQIFIASGPGIRIEKGEMYAHLAFLNSEFASQVLRKLTPKLTISAGYISKIPVCSEVLYSKYLAKLGNKCVLLKKQILMRNPTCIEFNWDYSKINDCLDIFAKKILIQDLTIELEKMQCESKINVFINNAMGYKIDLKSPCAQTHLSNKTLDNNFSTILDVNCSLTRTKVDKNGFGCDGPLEYLSKKDNLPSSDLYDFILSNVDSLKQTIAIYKDMVVHNTVLALMGYGGNYDIIHELCLDELDDALKKIFSVSDMRYLIDWIRTKFNEHHINAMLGSPFIQYNPEKDMLQWRA